MANAVRGLTAYNRDAILSATPAQLVVMLYDRMVLDLKRAEGAQLEERWPDAHPQLLHAQDILTELMSSLHTDVWADGEKLMAVYVYLRNALMFANINRDVERTREALHLIEPLRDAWTQAAASLAAAAASPLQRSGDLGVA